jgi:hypothetical protein
MAFIYRCDGCGIHCDAEFNMDHDAWDLPEGWMSVNKGYEDPPVHFCSAACMREFYAR